jgi:peroxiredoxin family protein
MSAAATATGTATGTATQPAPERENGGRKRLALVASKGTLDQAYPPLILATTAASMGWEAGVFFTFYGLDILHKKKYKKLKVPPLANPAMPVPVPNFIGALPGMTAVATKMMKGWMGKASLPELPEFIDMARGLGVQLFACSTTMGVMGIAEKDLIPGCEIAGAAAFLDYASEAQVQLFV